MLLNSLGAKKRTYYHVIYYCDKVIYAPLSNATHSLNQSLNEMIHALMNIVGNNQAASGTPNVTHGKDIDMSTPLARETLKQFRIILGAVRHHFRALETACGISGAQVWILAALAESPGITVSRLSEALSIHISTASNMLDKLAKAGMAERRRGEEDRRVVNLYLTEKGQATLGRAPQPLTGLVPNALGKLPESALARLHEDLALLIQQMNYVDLEAANKPLSTLVR